MVMLCASRVSQSRLANVAVIFVAATFTGLTPAFDCGGTYLTFSRDLLAAHGNDPHQLATLNRKALRFYDACRTGDLDDAAALFSRLHKDTHGPT